MLTDMALSRMAIDLMAIDLMEVVAHIETLKAQNLTTSATARDHQQIMATLTGADGQIRIKEWGDRIQRSPTDRRDMPARFRAEHRLG